MAIFVFSTKKPMGIAAYMDEGMRNVVLVGGLIKRICSKMLEDASLAAGPCFFITR